MTASAEVDEEEGPDEDDEEAPVMTERQVVGALELLPGPFILLVA